ncbi:hypothetical protein F4553_007425 [Allocatelliglobosispora scoriae]|uniref:Secreted protein n=1 Tax=Allocatelliglobosispora scoriae TaxID=643052 RepID=A0A841C5A1_9ACTN|nr:hypothetical protein [Allocatelliglobosispora scoriae]MBB5873991.1 hypothetical protein [Allocatelliglobosispora scoriae]
MKLRVLVATVAALAATVLSPASAQAGGASTQSCYGYNYAFTINSTVIHVVANPACPGMGTAWMVLQRANGNGGWDYLDDSNVQYPETIGTIHYLCNGTALNTFQVGPLFTAGVPGYTFYQFTDYCG